MENTLVPWTTEYYPNDVADTRHGCEKVYFLLNSLDDLSDAPKGSTALARIGNLEFWENGGANDY